MPIAVPKNRPPTTPGEIIQEEPEAVLGIDAGTWMNLQAACEIWRAKQTKPARGLKRLAALKTA